MGARLPQDRRQHDRRPLAARPRRRARLVPLRRRRGLLPDLREALTALLPGLRARSWHTRRCADAYTARYRPYIGALAPGVIAVLGGNGRGAQAADALGQLAARLALTGEWPPGLPRDEFRPVPGPGAWTGMTLLRDRARGPVP